MRQGKKARKGKESQTISQHSVAFLTFKNVDKRVSTQQASLIIYRHGVRG